MTSRNLHFSIRTAALVCAGLATSFASVALADGDDNDIWSCSLCANDGGWELDIGAGPAFVSGDDLFHFGDYTGFDEEGLYGTGDLFARYWGDDAQFFDIEGYRLGLDSQALFASGGQQGLYAVRASYQGIPRRIYDTTATPYRASGNEQLNLLSGWVNAATTQGMTALDSSLQAVEIKRDWGIYQLGVAYTPTSRWAFDGNYRHQKRDGKSISSAAFYFDATTFAAPVENTTDEVELVAVYEAETWQLSASYWGAFFDNGVSSLSWDNPYTALTPGADSGQLARAPDNDSHQIRLAGSMVLPARTTLVGHLSLGRMQQDDSFLPYTINSQITSGLLPSGSADAKVETTNFGLRVTSTPVRKFTLEGELRYNERDNQTEEQVFNYVVTDLVNATDSATNIAYDYERTEFKLRGEYRLMARTKLHAGYDYEEFNRSSQERGTTNTDLIWVQLRTRAIPLLDVDLKLYAEDRDGSSYTPIASVTAPQNPLMRKYNMADRERNGLRAAISAYASDRLNIGLNAEFNDDEYRDSTIGLLDSEFSRYGLDVSYVSAAGMSVYGGLSQEDVKTNQANSQTSSAPDWLGTTDDSFLTGNLGLTFPDVADGWDISAQFIFTESEGDTDNNTNGLASAFPAFESTLQQFRLGVDYRYSEALSLQFKYLYEKFDSDDWALEGVEPATVPNLLSLGADPWQYDAHVFYVGVRYVLGY